MDLDRLLLMTVLAPAGAVYLYFGVARSDRAFLFCGVLLAASPFVVGDLRVLAILEILLLAGPFVFRKIAQKRLRRR